MTTSKYTKLSTIRLDLVAATFEHVCAELISADHLATMLNAKIESGWPPGEYDRSAQEFFRDRLQQGGKAVIGWYSWYAILRQSIYKCPLLVGAGGYFGPPDDRGEVEIGFSILSAWKGRGYATELTSALVDNAFVDLSVQKVIAHTTAQNIASINVLKKAGFVCAGDGATPGSMRYEIPRALLLC